MLYNFIPFCVSAFACYPLLLNDPRKLILNVHNLHEDYPNNINMISHFSKLPHSVSYFIISIVKDLSTL